MATLICPLSRHQLRELDAHAERDLGLSTLTLMENAGRGAAALLAELTGVFTSQGAARPFSVGSRPVAQESPPQIVVLCGMGNNGGDGGVVARHLDAWGFPVRVRWFGSRDQLHGAPLTQWTILDRSGVDQMLWFDAKGRDPDPAELDELLTGADWLVDGLFGTGLARPVEGAFALVVQAMNRSGKPVLALDIPSGLDADTGVPLGQAVRARATATFVAPKIGFGAAEALDYTGTVEVIDIGLPRQSLRRFLV